MLTAVKANEQFVPCQDVLLIYELDSSRSSKVRNTCEMKLVGRGKFAAENGDYSHTVKLLLLTQNHIERSYRSGCAR